MIFNGTFDSMYRGLRLTGAVILCSMPVPFFTIWSAFE